MQRLWPVLAILAAGAVAWMLLAGDEEGGGYQDDTDVIGYDEQGNPILLTAEGAGPRETKPPAKKPDAADEDTDASDVRLLWFEGVVLSEATGQPIAGARLTAERGRGGPRLPRGPVTLADGRLAQPLPATTDASGRFRWMVDTVLHMASLGGYAVFVSAPGHVMAVRDGPGLNQGETVTIRLKKALLQAVRVTDLHSRPVEGTKLTILPAEGTPQVPGHASAAVSDADGRASLDGLLPGAVMLTADHPAFMPQTTGPFDPAKAVPLEVRLAPAYLLTFEIRSDDGSDIENPTLAWRTNGQPPHEDLVLLTVIPRGPESAARSEVHSLPVRIPCDHREVAIEIKADGFEPYIPQAELLPVNGGERTIVASLRRDRSLAVLDVRFEDPDANPVSYASLNPVLEIARLDPRPMSSGITVESGETLHFGSIPAGPYRILVRSAKFAPAEFDVEVRAGETNEKLVKLTEPARLKIRFTATEQLLVRFRILVQGKVIVAFPENADEAPQDAQAPLVVEGGEGMVLSGLPTGPVTVEVTSENLVAAPYTAHLRAGETVEADIGVRVR
jgi:protocatechuate 3,4-dioxygenase beta subunit